MDNDIEVVSYQSFVDIVVHIKRGRMKGKTFNATSFFEDKRKEKQLPKKTAAQQDYYVGSWYLIHFFPIQTENVSLCMHESYLCRIHM